MERKIYKVLDHRCRVTIPQQIRRVMDIGENDIISFSHNGMDTVVIKRERVCTECVSEPRETALIGKLDQLTPQEQYAALKYLNNKLI